MYGLVSLLDATTLPEAVRLLGERTLAWDVTIRALRCYAIPRAATPTHSGATRWKDSAFISGHY